MINIYCDESCHLENDNEKAMVIGGIWCPEDKKRNIINDIYLIKEKYGIKKHAEIKWVKVSESKKEYFKELVKYFFECSDLHFRAVVIPNKSKLNHKIFNQSHDDWYYKMYFEMLKIIIAPNQRYNIYLDIKDTRSADKVIKLKKFLSNNIYDFNYNIVKKVQNVRSEECVILQLADLLIGALGYFHREKDTNSAKVEIVEQIKQLSGYSLRKNTLYKEEKFNLLIWEGREGV